MNSHGYFFLFVIMEHLLDEFLPTLKEVFPCWTPPEILTYK